MWIVLRVHLDNWLLAVTSPVCSIQDWTLPLQLGKVLRNSRGSLTWRLLEVAWVCQVYMASPLEPLSASASSEERGLLSPAWPQTGTLVLPSKDTRGNAPCLYSQWCVATPEPTQKQLAGKLHPLGCLVVELPTRSPGLWSSCCHTVSPLADTLPSRPLTLAVGNPGFSRAQSVQHILADPCA